MGDFCLWGWKVAGGTEMIHRLRRFSRFVGAQRERAGLATEAKRRSARLRATPNAREWSRGRALPGCVTPESTQGLQIVEEAIERIERAMEKKE